MVGTAQAVAARSRGALEEGAFAVAVYTLQVLKRVVWFGGSGVVWHSLPERTAQVLETAWQTARGEGELGEIVQLFGGKMVLRQGHPTDSLFVALEAERTKDPVLGPDSGVKEGLMVGRYENDVRGDMRWSPLHDSAAWLAVEPETGWVEDIQRSLPRAP
eukprot:Hpha_TRINITY_DN36255_c0_g1::TRINITY_DN36255_c0_g1_i1::g.83175::m.83175